MCNPDEHRFRNWAPTSVVPPSVTTGTLYGSVFPGLLETNTVGFSSSSSSFASVETIPVSVAIEGVTPVSFASIETTVVGVPVSFAFEETIKDGVFVSVPCVETV